jgi:hypothetical protein
LSKGQRILEERSRLPGPEMLDARRSAPNLFAQRVNFPKHFHELGA